MILPPMGDPHYKPLLYMSSLSLKLGKTFHGQKRKKAFMLTQRYQNFKTIERYSYGKALHSLYIISLSHKVIHFVFLAIKNTVMDSIFGVIHIKTSEIFKFS